MSDSGDASQVGKKFFLYKEVHRYADTDDGADAIHHKIGTGPFQAASGRDLKALTDTVDDSRFRTGDVKMSMNPVTDPGWLELNGAAVSREDYSALFLLFGTTYGAGDGSTTFNLPNFDNRVPRAGGIIGSTGGADGISTVVQSGAGINVAGPDARDRFMRIRFLVKT